MAFDSIFFISCFLPLCLAIYFLMPSLQAKNRTLLILSLVFYLCSGLTPLLLLLGISLINFGAGYLLSRNRCRKLVLLLGILVNLSALGIYKYLDFALTQILGQPALALGLVAPLGISFFTFKSISYLIDTYRQPAQVCKSLPRLMLYISFFPQMIMGPITRYGAFSAQLDSRTTSLSNTALGLRRFVVGLAKKLFLSAVLGTMVDGIFALETGNLDFRLAWLAAIGYSLQLFFDFSGYMDIAIGLGQVFGFSTPENFNAPYTASSVSDFWRRWHITLSAWFKDYVYIPLGGNRKGAIRTGLHKCIVFLLCGLWHGASWTFVLWGAWHGLFCLLESTGVIQSKKLEKSHILGHIYTLLVVCLGFVMFRAESVAQGFAIIGAMFTGFHFTAIGTVTLFQLLTPQVIVMGLAGILLCIPAKRCMFEKRPALSWIVTCLLFILCLLRLAAGDFAPAIYAQF